MKILIIGCGGREHALSWKAAQSAHVTQVFVAPGNAGTALEPKLVNVPINEENIEQLLAFALRQQIDLTIVGPEKPLVNGIVDLFQKNNLIIFGPTRAAAHLEGSKAFAKDFLVRNKIPTAKYQCFTKIDPAVTYVRQQGLPIVIKVDGLAAGKGVTIAMSFSEAETAIKDALSTKQSTKAARRIVIEEHLAGEEVSFIVVTDGKNALPMATSKDHKRAFDGDNGPNTGGMGAYSPAPDVTDKIFQQIMTEIIQPTILGMANEGNQYIGCLYAGLMITKDGCPKVLEYNCRFGDPETQPIMLRMQSDLVELCLSVAQGNLAEQNIIFDKQAAVGVVLAAKGYPGDYAKKEVIGLPQSLPIDTKIFHAGTVKQQDKIINNGGRVLCVTSLGKSIITAQHAAYNLVSQVQWQGGFYRTDIAQDIINKEIITNNDC